MAVVCAAVSVVSHPVLYAVDVTLNVVGPEKYQVSVQSFDVIVLPRLSWVERSRQVTVLP